MVGNIGDADDGIVIWKCASFAEVEGKIAGDDDNFFAVRKIVIKVAAEIMMTV